MMQTNGESRTDGELLSAYADRRDADAFKELHRRYGSLVFSLAMRYLHNSQDAEDVTAACFAVLLRKADSLKSRTNLGGWFHWCAVRTAKNVLMARIHRAEREQEAYKMRETEQQAQKDRFEGMMPQLEAGIAELPANMREALVMYFYQGFTQSQIAMQMRRPENTISTWIKRGVSKLRKNLGVSEDEFSRSFSTYAVALPVPATLTARLTLLGEGKALGGHVAALADRIVGTMFWAQFRSAAAILAAAVLVGGSIVGVTSLALAAGGDASSSGKDVKAASPSSAEIKGPPKREHYAFGNIAECYNGPKKQALTSKCSGAPDEAGNVFIRDFVSYGTIRCITTDGQVIPISGNDYWTPPTGEKEGPAYMLALGPAGGFGGYVGGGVVAHGRPLEGGEKGAIYVSDKKIYKNKDGLWWFKTIPELQGLVQIGKDGKVYVSRGGECFRYEDGKLTKLLDRKDYAGKVGLTGNGAWPESTWLMGNDGSFYLQRSVEGPITRIWPDKQRVENYVVNLAPNSWWDGPATKSGWYCGPMIDVCKTDQRYLPPGVLIIHTADEHCVRRVRDGRVSTLYPDGEWRENPGKKDGGGALNWFRAFSSAPNGTAFQTYSSHEDIRTYRVTGIDWAKATVGPQVEKK
ncbi:MAG: hypothetical protein C0404_02465 [Verrucomicrobia bacterium]|nr:hypothetical protein [Verrucomicrobiota bacterium]